MKIETAEKILAAVERDSGSDSYEIAERLGRSGKHSGNSIWKQLSALVAARLLLPEKGMSGGSVGRPRTIYHLTPQAHTRLMIKDLRKRLEQMEQTLDLGDEQVILEAR